MVVTPITHPHRHFGSLVTCRVLLVGSCIALLLRELASDSVDPRRWDKTHSKKPCTNDEGISSVTNRLTDKESCSNETDHCFPKQVEPSG